jgi:glutamyl-tRNA synthetase
VDDIDMKVSHIIRGEDHLSNSAIHVEIFQSLDSEVPSFGHNPLMLNEDGTKLSKRNVDSISIKKFREQNFSTESILSYLYSVGLNADYNFKEISKKKYVDFDLSKISKNLPKLDLSKIDHFQKLTLRTINLKELLDEFNNLTHFNIKEMEWNLIKNNVDKYDDILEFLAIIRRQRVENSPSDNFVKLLVTNLDKFEGLDFEEYTKQLSELDSKLTKKDIFVNTRYLLTGNNNGPSVKDLFEYYGFNEIKNNLNDFKAL